MITLFLSALWYLLPAGIGNMTPILAAKTPVLRRWKTPLDFGKQWNGQRIFGTNKTVRGLVFGILAGVAIGWVQKLTTPELASLVDLPVGLYEGATPLILGGLLAAGALLGDAIESFFKRQVGVAAGDSWFPFDQLDYIVGACLAAAILGLLSFSHYAAIIFVWFVMHLLFSYIGYVLHFKSKPI